MFILYLTSSEEIEWHYIDIEQSEWENQIKERNEKVNKGNGGYDFYFDENLMNKMLSQFEEPTRDEIDVWYTNKH